MIKWTLLTKVFLLIEQFLVFSGRLRYWTKLINNALEFKISKTLIQLIMSIFLGLTPFCSSSNSEFHIRWYLPLCLRTKEILKWKIVKQANRTSSIIPHFQITTKYRPKIYFYISNVNTKSQTPLTIQCENKQTQTNSSH
jgi:hypothetical protein